MLTDKKYAGNINQRKGARHRKINLKEKRMILRTRLPNVKDTKRRRKSTSSNASKNRWGASVWRQWTLRQKWIWKSFSQFLLCLADWNLCILWRRCYGRKTLHLVVFSFDSLLKILKKKKIIECTSIKGLRLKILRLSWYPEITRVFVGWRNTYRLEFLWMCFKTFNSDFLCSGSRLGNIYSHWKYLCLIHANQNRAADSSHISTNKNSELIENNINMIRHVSCPV